MNHALPHWLWLGGALVTMPALLAAGCGVKEDVTLLVSTQGLTLTKSKGAFDFRLDGTVDVVFEMGKYAGDPVRVEAISLQLQRGTTQILPTTRVEPPAGTSYPFDLAPGQRHALKYKITKDQLVGDDATVLCAGPVRVSGVVKQVGKPEIPIFSDPIPVAGCP